MVILGDKRLKLIDNLNLSDALKKLTSGEFVHDELELRCLELKYSLETEDFSPTDIDAIPLWESDTSITAFYLDENLKPVFIHYYIEDIDDYKVVGRDIYDLVNFLVDEYVDYDLEQEVKALLLRKKSD
jgi:hypothetical protein